MRKAQNLQVVRVDPERNVLLVKGAVPGPPGGFVVVQARVEIEIDLFKLTRMPVARATTALFATLLLFMVLVGNQLAAQERPNILLIVSDDQGYNDLGVLGNGIITPALDRLAREGTRLTNFYVSWPITIYLIVHQANDVFLVFIPVIMDSLNQ